MPFESLSDDGAAKIELARHQKVFRESKERKRLEEENKEAKE